MTDPKRTVWILGAGFSKGLGGPLLYDLLSAKALEQLKTQIKVHGPFQSVYQTYWAHHKSPPEPVQVNRRFAIWENAEEFLDFADAAARNPTGQSAQVLARTFKDDGSLPAPEFYADFLRRCVRAIAVECNFAGHVDHETAEAWQPYKTWVSQLGATDTILTFNYDLVLEKLMRPESALREDSWAFPGVRPSGPGVRVYKLHGSIDWSTLYKKRAAFNTLLGGEDYPLMGTPGATKAEHTSTHFATLWEEAKKELTGADRIVFLGYRFPPSDAQSRTELLGAIKDNPKDGILDIHTVLGLPSNDSRRLGELLKAAAFGGKRFEKDSPLGSTKRYTLTQHALYVEDFLSLYPHVVGS